MLTLALMLIAAEPLARPMTVEVRQDPINDAIRASAILRDDGNRLDVTCETIGNEPRISFHSRLWLGRGHFLSGRRRITYRFDREAPRRSWWDIEDRRATLTNDVRVNNFIQGLYTAERLVIRGRDVENRPFNAIFRVTDARPAIERALAACGRDSDGTG